MTLDKGAVQGAGSRLRASLLTKTVECVKIINKAMLTSVRRAYSSASILQQSCNIHAHPCPKQTTLLHFCCMTGIRTLLPMPVKRVTVKLFTTEAYATTKCA
jgi:hypothetical protein